MTLAAYLTPKNGQVVLNKSDTTAGQPLDGLALLFDAVAGSNTTLTIDVPIPAKNGILTGTTSAWDQKTSDFMLTFEGETVLSVTVRQALTGTKDPWNIGLHLGSIYKVVAFSRGSDSTQPLRIAQRYEATAQFGDINVGLSAQLKDGKKLELIFECSGVSLGLGQVLHLVGSDPDPAGDLRWMPDGFQDAAKVTVERLVLRLEPSVKHPIAYAEADLTLGPPEWHVLPDLSFPVIQKPMAILSVDHPMEPDLRFASAALIGDVVVGKGQSPIHVRAAWPDLRLSAKMDANGAIDLIELAKELRVPTKVLPSGTKDRLLLKNLSMTGQPTAKTKSFDLKAHIVPTSSTPGKSHWSIPLGPNAALALLDLTFGFHWQSKSGASGMIAAKGAVVSGTAANTSTFNISAASNTAGWVFSGHWQADPSTPATLGKWIGDLAHGIDPQFEFPTFLNALTVSDVTLNFDTKTENLKITIATATGSTNINLTLSAGPDPSGSWALHAEGRLHNDTASFSLIFERGSSNRVIAVLDAERPVTADLADLAAMFGPSTPTLPSMTVGFKSAVAVAQTSKTAAENLTLLAVDLETSADLTQLPLVGPTIGEHGGFSAQFQLSYSSRAGAKKDAELIDAVNAKLPEGATHLPDATKIPKGPNMLALLKTGDTTIPLDMPVKPTADGEPEDDPSKPTPKPASDGYSWKDLDKTIGPVHLARVDAKYSSKGGDPSLSLLLDGDLSMGPVTLSLAGLGVDAAFHPKAKAPSPKVSFDPHLNGLGLAYDNGGVQMAGLFLRQVDANGDVEYSGAARIGTPNFTLSAIGSYASRKEGKSLFLYGVLDMPLGGPAFFFVTGLAAGFGYNRALNMPDVDKVADFPLVSIAQNPPKTKDLSKGLRALSDAVPIAFDEYFLAVGIKFNSFKLIDSFAMVAVQFGKSVELDMLGLSTAIFPTPVGSSPPTPVAMVQVGIAAKFRPEEGVLRLDARLTEASFVLSKKCKLRGGFAFYAWFKDQPNHSAGDFVVTLGGYHPKYDIKAHPDYPIPPRVSIDWPVTRTVHIKGDMYCALTPGAMMAGEHVSANYHDGHVRAWFKAGMDFLMEWKPFHYDAIIYVDVGGSYTHKFFGWHTITIDVGADLHLWGPEFAGTAKVSLYIASFTVSLGAGGRPSTPKISWNEFQSAFLPEKDHWVTSALATGVRSDDPQWPDVDPHGLSVQIDSAMPFSSVTCGATTKTITTKIGVAPCKLAPGEFENTLKVTVTQAPLATGPALQTAPVNDVTASFVPEFIHKEAPSAMWGNYRDKKELKC